MTPCDPRRHLIAKPERINFGSLSPSPPSSVVGVWQVGQYRDALREANTCIELAPDWPKGYTRKGLASYYLGSFDTALEAYTKALELDPENSQLKEKLEEMQGLIAERQGSLNAPNSAKPENTTKPATAKYQASVATLPGPDPPGNDQTEAEIDRLVSLVSERAAAWDFEQCIVYRDQIYAMRKAAGMPPAVDARESSRNQERQQSSSTAQASVATATNDTNSGGGGGKNKKKNKKQNKEAAEAKARQANHDTTPAHFSPINDSAVLF